MVRKCSVPGCRSNYSPSVKKVPAFQFPNKEPYRTLWIKAISKPNWQPTAYTYICSLHFTESCYSNIGERHRLLPDAVPSIFPNYPVEYYCESWTWLNIFKPKVPSNFDLTEFESVCRICLNSVSNLLQLFDNEIDSLISEFLPQKLNRNSFQPQKICCNCYEEAKTAYIFKKQCQYSDELIRSMVNEPNISKTYEKQTQTDFSNNFIYPYEKCDKLFEEASEISGEHRLNMQDKTTNACLENFVTNDVINEAIEEDCPKFVKIDKYEFNCEHCLENFEVENDLKLHECTNFLESALEENSSNMLQLINDCDKNEIQVDPLCDENSGCNSLFEDNLKTDDRHEENTVEKNKTNPNNIRFDCNICFKQFVRKSNLQRHVNSVHTDLKPFHCPTCKKSFKQEHYLKSHIRRISCLTAFYKKGELFQCEICLKKFFKKEYLQDHKAVHHDGIKEFSCKYCSEKIFGEMEYKKHCKTHITHTKPKPYLCWECGANFTKPQDLEVHVMRHRAEKPYKCQYCDRDFVTPSERRAHEKSHTGEKNYHCTECSKAFARPYKLRVHMRIHTGERPYKCSHCSKAFNENNALKQHERLHTGERFNCDICDANFLQPSLLKNHKRKIHRIDVPRASTSLLDNTKTQKTEEQISSSSKNKTVSMEIIKDDSTELFSCSACGVTFTKVQYLNTHLMRHIGEKPHKCRKCDRAFVTSSERIKHERKHDGKKKIHCNICSKAFSRSYALRVHMRTHTGERPYKCLYCSKAFAQSNDLKAHHRRHTGEKFYCDLCDLGFVYMHILKKHKLKAHGIGESGSVYSLLIKPVQDE